MRTSEEAYREYIELREREEKASRKNRGANLLNINKLNNKTFFVSIKKKIESNLIEKKEEIVINDDFSIGYHWGGCSPEEFLKDLKKFVSIPMYEYLIQRNRKQDNKPSFWNLDNFRKKTIRFENIVFDVGHEAMKSFDVEKFKTQVKELLDLQRRATPEEEKDFERYYLLCNTIEDLERQVKDTNQRYYSYGEMVDRTKRIVALTPQEYNNELRAVSREITKLCKKYSFLTEPRFEYIEIKKKPTFKQFKDTYEGEAQDGWDMLDDDEKDEYDGDFDKFLKERYEDFLEQEGFD